MVAIHPISISWTLGNPFSIPEWLCLGIRKGTGTTNEINKVDRSYIPKREKLRDPLAYLLDFRGKDLFKYEDRLGIKTLRG